MLLYTLVLGFNTRLQMSRASDVVVVGAGVFGAWTALQLRRTGRSVTLVDAFGTGSSRSSSSGASRIIRVGYGAEAIYSRWAQRSFHAWRELFREWRQELFIRTGVLLMARTEDPIIDKTIDILTRLHVPFEQLDRPELEQRYPQFNFGPIVRGVVEPDAGVILARRGAIGGPTGHKTERRLPSHRCHRTERTRSGRCSEHKRR